MWILIFAFSLIVNVHAISFNRDSSSSSCDDDSRDYPRHHHHHHHHHGGGGYYGGYGGGGGKGNGGGSGNGGGHGGGNGGGKPDKGGKSRCPDGWKLFERPTGPWCMKVFPTGVIEYAAAKSFCVSNGAVLSGIQNKAENVWITQTALNTLGSPTGTVWIGAERTPQCLGQGKTAACNDYTSLAWTDSSTTGTEGFVWLEGIQPDNYKRIQNCLILFFTATPVRILHAEWWAGAIDDIMCNPAQWETLGPNREKTLRGVVCGKPARK
uniref:C-type lectin domain-containing protein n=1 Tax=Caenorhabditis japonica TaxID=281687 RepID=A0A8R1DWG7_CAEJA